MALDSNLRRPRPRSACLLLLGLAFAGLLAGSGHARPGGPTFTSGVYVDQQLAGGEPNQVSMGPDTLEGPGSLGHEVFVSNDGGLTCSATGIADSGSLADGGSWTAFGKLQYDRRNGSLVEPAMFQHGDGSFGVGISTLTAGGSTFTPHEALRGTSMYAHWPAIAIDAAGAVYLVWDTDDRPAGTTGGCHGARTPAANSIMLVSTTDLGKSWSAPVTVAHTDEIGRAHV